MPKPMNLQGKKFGKLTAIEYIGGSKWRCACDCGGECVRCTAHLIHGKTTSCGCAYKRRQYKDLTNKKFGKLTAKEYVGHSCWLCQCECGGTVIKARQDLESGKADNCGCLTFSKLSKSRTKHGMSRTRVYGRWQSMIRRCYSPASSGYTDYGGRGIYVCEEWRNDFMAYYRWLIENGFDESIPAKLQSVDRIDNDGPYAPWNCRLANQVQQCQNQRPKKGRPDLKRKVVAYNESGDTVASFDSITDACKWIGEGKIKNVRAQISHLCATRDTVHRSHGYFWRYAEDA